ncbi:MAG: roadblock/LC7 domain-containing protein [Anaerolineales bacterium]
MIAEAVKQTSARKTHPQAIRHVLEDFLESSPYIRAVAVVRVSGLAVEAIMPPTIEEERASAMAAVMLLLGERITESMQTGELEKVYIKGKDGHIILMAVGHQAVLTVMAAHKAPLGMLFVEMRAAARKLKRLV